MIQCEEGDVKWFERRDSFGRLLPRMTSSLSETPRQPMAPAVNWSATGEILDDLPSWVSSLAATGARTASARRPIDAARGSDITALSRDAFRVALEQLDAAPCRVWAFLPRPTDHDGDEFERYMRFNAGRSEAYRALGGVVKVVPAGTCVGHAGTDLVVHVLATDQPFSPVENPRQRPAWNYSRRFGPTPPTFVRATRTPALLLASGTASVVGEESLHLEDIDAQFEETLANLASLSDAGGGDGRWRSVQIYVRDAAHLDRIQALATEAFGDGLERVLHAPLCRRELLVEIEGVCNVAKPHA